MPNMVMAVFMQASSEETKVRYGLKVHAQLLETFWLSEDDMPLLEYDATSPSEPFRTYSGARKFAAPSIVAGKVVDSIFSATLPARIIAQQAQTP
jgi:hypothetical protein